VTTTAGVDSPSELEELPETVAVEREQEPTDHEEGVEEKGELTSLVQQPEAVEEAAGVARLFGGRGLGESVWHIPHSFSFSPQKRDRKLSDEEQTRSSRRRRSGPSRRWSSTAAEEALLRRRRFRVAREHKTYKIGDIATEHGPRDPCTQPREARGSSGQPAGSHTARRNGILRARRATKSTIHPFSLAAPGQTCKGCETSIMGAP